VRPRTFEDVRRRHAQVGPAHLQRLALAGAELSRKHALPGHMPLPCTLLRRPAQRSEGGAGPADVLRRTREPLRGVANEIFSLRARELGLARPKWRPQLFKRMEFQASVMGHFCAVYCLTFDRTGLRYITGSDDKLIKIWVSRSGILLRTLRGHVSDIVDLSVSCDNRFLASCSNDQDVRIWFLHNGAPLAVLPGHGGPINNVEWSASLNMDLSQQLYSWSDDGTLRMWRIDSSGVYTGCQVLSTLERVRSEGPSTASGNAAIGANCAAFDPLGRWVAMGCADNLIRVYWLNAPNARPNRFSGHAGEVGHIMTNQRGDLIVSGSVDGTVRLWPLSGLSWPLQVDYQRARVLNMRTGERTPSARGAVEKHRLNMVILTPDASKVVTSQNLEKKRKDGSWDVRIKVWDVDSGELVHNFNQHHDQAVHVLECHPTEANVVASAGYDARVYFWDVLRGDCVAKFQISFRLDDRLHPVGFDQNSAEIFEGKWHPNGMCFMTTHKNGFTSFMSVSNHTDSFKKTPREQFFQVDFGELIQDQQHNVIDRAAQVPPHTMPSGHLCDRFGQALEIGSLTGGLDMAPHALLVSPPRMSRQQISDMGFPDADAALAAEMQEEAFEERSDSDEDDDEDFMEEDDDEEEDADYSTRDERRAAKRKEKRLKQQQTAREMRAAAFAQRRHSQRPSRASRDDGSDDSYSEQDLSDSELFVLPKKKSRDASRREDTTGWQPEQQRRRPLTQAELDKNISRSRDWLLVTSPPKNVDHGYVPQIGDDVVYFRQGHEEQLCDYPEAQCQRAHQPWEEFALKPAEKCQITDIKYQIPATNEPPENSVYCILHLKRLPESLQPPKPGRKFAKGQPVKARWQGGHRFPGVVEECNDDGTYVVQFDDGDREPAEPEDLIQAQTFVVSYRRTDLAEFVLPLYRYERHERNVFGPGDRFKMLFENKPEPYQGTVMQMRPFHPKDFPDSPWQCLEVRWDEKEEGGEDDDRVSPWEIMPLSEQPGPLVFSTDLSDAERTRLHAGLEGRVMVTDLARPFNQPPGAHTLAYVPLPLCLETVVVRLGNAYYRSVEQVKHDLRVICRNAFLATRPDEGLLRRALVLEEVLDALLAGQDLDIPLAKWDAKAEAEATSSGPAASIKSERRQALGGATDGASGSGSGARMVVAKVSPETTWKSQVREALAGFDKQFGGVVKRWSAAGALESPSAVQTMVETWQCCEYEALLGKVASGEYGGLNAVNTLGYDLLSLCCKVLLLRSPGSDDWMEARNALQRALALFSQLKGSHPYGAAPAAPVRTSRRGIDGDHGFTASLESLQALDPAGVLNQIPSALPASCSGESGKDEMVSTDDAASAGVKGLQEIMASAPSYRSPEELGVDLLVLCGTALLQGNEMAAYATAASVVAKGILLFPKTKAISLKISLGRGAEQGKAAAESSNRPARRQPEAGAGAGDESSKGKECASSEMDRATRAALRHSNSQQHSELPVNAGTSSSAAAGEGSCERRSGVRAGGVGALSIDCPGTRETLKKCLSKLRAADVLGIFENPVTDDVAPGYSKLILNPMCFSDVQQELERGGYDGLPQLFVADFLLIVANALIFNEPGDDVSDAALTLAKRGINLLADKLPEWNALLESSAASNARDKEEAGAYAPLLVRLRTLRALDSTKLFEKPVCNAQVPGYSSVIKLPMDISTIEKAILGGRYIRCKLMLCVSLCVHTYTCSACLLSPLQRVASLHPV